MTVSVITEHHNVLAPVSVRVPLSVHNANVRLRIFFTGDKGALEVDSYCLPFTVTCDSESLRNVVVYRFLRSYGRWEVRIVKACESDDLCLLPGHDIITRAPAYWTPQQSELEFTNKQYRDTTYFEKIVEERCATIG